MTDSIEALNVIPECQQEFGCKKLEGYVANERRTSPEREELIAKCVEYCLSEGTDQVCYMADSFQSFVSSSEQGGQNA